MNGLEKLKMGNFNAMSQQWESSDVVNITLVKRGEGKVYKLKVKDLYGSNEEVLEEEVIG